MRSYRASSLPTAFSCAGAAQPPALAVDPVSDPANEGSAGHEVMRWIAERDAASLDGLDLGAIAREWSVDVEDLRIAAFNGLAIWKLIRTSFPGARGEADFSVEVLPPGTYKGIRDGRAVELVHDGATFTGHADLLAEEGDRANGADWKFGRVDRDYAEQMLGYCALVLLTRPHINEVSWSIVWMREREVEAYSMTREQLPAWIARFRTRIVEWDGVLRPGTGCFHCPRSRECPAIVATVRRDVALLESDELAARIETGLQDLEPADVAKLYRRASMLSKICDSAKDAVKLHVENLGGALDVGDGTELVFTTSEKRKLDVPAAWPLLQQRMEIAELLDGVVEIRMSNLDDAIAKKAGRGRGAAAKRALESDLEAAGALVRVPSRRFTDRRKKSTP